MNADVKIIFIEPNNNQVVITGRVDGLSSLSVTLTDELKKSFTSELEFYDDGYNILKYWLLDHINAFSNEVKVNIYDNCCNTLIFDGVVRANNIDWCEPICSIKTNLIEADRIPDCLKSTVIWDNRNGFLAQEQKRLRYCVDIRPDGLFYILIVFYTIFSILLLFVQAILGVVAFLLTLFTWDWEDFGDNYNNLAGWVGELKDRMLICNWYHPTALVRDYIKNVCDICGLQFQSSILNDAGSPYYNTLLFAAQIRKGYKPSQTTGLLINQNLPTETLDTLMESHLKPLFNANYWVKNGKLIFERKDYFDQADVWIDIEPLLNDGLVADNRVCYSYLDKDRPAFAVYEYIEDPIDFVGNYAKQRFDKIVEWNNPYSPTQSGKHEVILTSSAARFRGDDINVDSFDYIVTYAPSIDLLFDGRFTDSQNYLLLGDHVCSNYKFLIWDEDSGNEQSIVKHDYSNEFVGGGFVDIKIDEDTGNVEPFYVDEDKRFNYPFSFFLVNNSPYPTPVQSNLYNKFHYIDNPKIGLLRNFNFEFTFNFNCSQYLNFDFTKTVRLFKNGQIVYGKVKSLNINFVNRTMTVSGEV